MKKDETPETLCELLDEARRQADIAMDAIEYGKGDDARADAHKAIATLAITLNQIMSLHDDAPEREKPFIATVSHLIKPVETLAAIPAEHLDNELCGKSIEKVCDALDCVSYAYENLLGNDRKIVSLAKDAALSFVAGLIGVGVCAWICCLCFDIPYKFKYSIGAYFAALMLQFAVKGFNNTGDKKDDIRDAD